MIETLENYNKVAWTLHQDVEFAKWLIENERNPEQNLAKTHRLYTKALFTYFEGVIFQLKQLALAKAAESGVHLTEAEITLLKEIKYRVSNNGEPEETFDMIDLSSNIKFTAKLFAKAYSSSYEADYSDNIWDSFRKSKKIRNRLTHPKNKEELEITSDELELLYESENWFWEWFLPLLKETGFQS